MSQSKHAAAVRKSANPLMKTLLKAGLVQPGDSGLGMKITEDGQCVGVKGPSDLIYACGPQLMDRDFEATAVSNLRVHARTAAQIVLQGCVAAS